MPVSNMEQTCHGEFVYCFSLRGGRHVCKPNERWSDTYCQAALEVDGHKMPARISDARRAITGRLRDLENDSDHHAERREIQSALMALTALEDDVRRW